MAQTKRRRRTKHRGNAAGVVETRGRTGRRPTDSERKPTKGSAAARPHRLDSPPTWKGVAQRTAFIVALLLVILVVATRKPILPLLVLSVFMFAVYVPLGYYTDNWMYRRRQRQRAEGKLR
jgi:hypothetical protein